MHTEREPFRKERWRRAYLAKRRARLAAGPVTRRAVITAGSLSVILDAVPAGATIAGYIPFSTEVDPAPVLHRWVDAGGIALEPTPESITTRGEVSPKWRNLVSKEVEEGELRAASLVLVPGLVFGVDGRRLGRGGGWYDRALSAVRPGTPVVGVCHDDEVVGPGLIPWEAFDQPVTWIATPQRLLRAGRVPHARQFHENP